MENDRKSTGDPPSTASRARRDPAVVSAVQNAVDVKAKLRAAKRSAAARRGHETRERQRMERGESTVKDATAAVKNSKKKKKKAGKKAIAGKGKGGKSPGTIRTIEIRQYNEMWREYCETQSIQKCAEAAGVGYDTARKYITGPGEPELGMVPIRQRHIQAMAEAQQQEELTLAQFQAQMFKNMTRLIDLHVGEIGMAQKDLIARVDAFDTKKARAKPGEIVLPDIPVTLDKLVKSFDTAVRLAEHLMGGADVSIETRDRSRFEGWTKEERDDYITKGIVPEHAR